MNVFYFSSLFFPLNIFSFFCQYCSADRKMGHFTVISWKTRDVDMLFKLWEERE